MATIKVRRHELVGVVNQLAEELVKIGFSLITSKDKGRDKTFGGLVRCEFVYYHPAKALLLVIVVWGEPSINQKFYVLQFPGSVNVFVDIDDIFQRANIQLNRFEDAIIREGEAVKHWG